MKKISWEEDFIHEINLCYVYWKKKTQLTKPFMILFYFKICYVKKIKSTSNENVDQFLIWKKYRSTSNEDANQFLTWGKFGSTSKEDAYPFFI